MAIGTRRVKVVFMMRRPRPHGNYSVEHLFKSVFENLSPRFEADVKVSRYVSNGLFRRMYNVFEAALRQGDINHVTGDVNILTFLLDGRRTVLTVLDCGRIEGPMDLRKFLIRWLWFRIPSRRVAAITVISHAVKEQLLRHVEVDPNKIHVVWVAVPAVYQHIPKSFNTGRPRILQIGAGENKNRERLFEALRGIPCTLDLVGPVSATQKELLQRYGLDATNHVNISNEQMLELYKNSDIVAFPSTFEGFGMPIVEANLVGRVVVTGNVTSMPEIAGDAACLVDPFDVGSIRKGFRRVIEDEAYREQLIRNGFENAKRFDPARITREYEALYEQLLSNREVAAVANRRFEAGSAS